MQELTLLNDKLDVLLKKYALLKSENNRLQQTVNEQLQHIEQLNHKLAGLEENMMAANMNSDTVIDDKDKQVVKKQLDTVIGEIDKILATLND